MVESTHILALDVTSTFPEKDACSELSSKIVCIQTLNTEFSAEECFSQNVIYISCQLKTTRPRKSSSRIVFFELVYGNIRSIKFEKWTSNYFFAYFNQFQFKNCYIVLHKPCNFANSFNSFSPKQYFQNKVFPLYCCGVVGLQE